MQRQQELDPSAILQESYRRTRQHQRELEAELTHATRPEHIARIRNVLARSRRSLETIVSAAERLGVALPVLKPRWQQTLEFRRSR